jgi:hypothetical protein
VPTPTPPETPADDQADEMQGRGAAPAESRNGRPARRRRPAPEGETKGRKLSLPDSVYDRLQLLAIRRRATVSAIATEILDRNLPKLRIEQD